MANGTCRGFTLVEIMIALAIFAVVSSALIKNAGMAVRQAAIIQERTIAYWVAENHLSRMRQAAHVTVAQTEPEFPGLGTDLQTVTMAGREWTLRVSVSATENEFMRRIEVEVMPEDTSDQALVALTGFVGRY